jgi:hypothetical protein
MDTFARGNSEANMKIAKYKRQRVRDEHIDFALKSSQSPFEFEQLDDEWHKLYREKKASLHDKREKGMIKENALRE